MPTECVYHDNGQLRVEMNMRENGRYHGAWVEYHPNGFISKKTQFVDGHQEGKYYEYSDTFENVILERSSYVQGRMHGLCSLYYANGKLREKGKYIDGLRVGKWTQYYQVYGTSRPLKKFEGEYVQGQKHGTWRHVKYGRLLMEENYEHGQHHGTQTLYLGNGGIEIITWEHGVITNIRRMDARRREENDEEEDDEDEDDKMVLDALKSGGFSPALPGDLTNSDCPMTLCPIDAGFVRCTNPIHQHCFDAAAYQEYAKTNDAAVTCPMDKTFKMNPQLYLPVIVLDDE